MRILVVEDSVRLQHALVKGLTKAGYAVDAVGDGVAGLIHAQTSDYDVVILDLMLPGMNGLEVLEKMRAKKIMTHVLVLTAMDEVSDKVKGLRKGADDYMVKPFEFDELLARVEALMRRQYVSKNPVIALGDLNIDTRTKEVLRGGVFVELTKREYAVLEYLAYRQGHAVSRMELEEHIYDENNQVMSNAIDSAICALRNKLHVEGQAQLIHTKRGFGYVLKEVTS